MLGSFKYKLALYFLLLAVVPMTAAFWAFGSVAKHAEGRKVDARVQAELRAVVAGYEGEIQRVAATARAYARRADVQRALRSGDARGLPSGVRLAARHKVLVGSGASPAATRVVTVRRAGRPIGSVMVELPLDRRLLRSLRSASGIASGDRIVFAPQSRPLGSPRGVTVAIGKERYRAFATPPLAEQPKVQLAVLAPAGAIDAEVAKTRMRLLYVWLGALVLLAGIAAAEGRSVMRSVGELASAADDVGRGSLDRRVPVRGHDEFAALARSFNSMADQLRTRLVELDVERTRLRQSIDRTGELLTATHDEAQLLSVITSAAVEAADAEGGVLLGEDGTVVEVGTVSDDAERVELALATAESRFGILILYGVAKGETGLTATRALVAQAAVALENARLHEIVEQRAISDGLTGLANRRHCEERLADEVARSERYGNPLAVILADVDNFKAANDTHGHGFGDLALQQFAAVLNETLRDVDVSGRWGGEEFLVVLPGTSPAGAVEAAERIRSAFAALDLPATDGPTRITVSLGVAAFRPGATPEQIVRAADEALYEAKRRGKNRVATGAGVEPAAL